MPRDRLRNDEGPREIGFDVVAPDVKLDVEKWPGGARAAGVVGQDVEATGCRDRGVDKRSHLIGLGDVGWDRASPTAGRLDIGNGRVERRGVALRDHHARALRRESQGNGAPDARAAARDQRGFSVESSHVFPPDWVAGRHGSGSGRIFSHPVAKLRAEGLRSAIA